MAGSSAPEPTLAPGSVFAGRYVIEAKLGAGGMGAVHRVFDRALGEHVALKTLLGPREDDRARERFRDEVRLARRITHPNIARTFDFGSHSDIDYLTMELLAGQSLRALLAKQAPLARTRALSITRQLCEGLRAAHAVGVVHCDLKPQNIVVENDSRVVILDFGIASSVRDTRTEDEVAGSPAYMDPAVLSGAPPSFGTDLYAIGLVLHEMLSGHLPNWNGSERDPVARLGGVVPQLGLHGQPDALIDLVRRLLLAAPEARPASAAEVLAVLDSLDEERTRTGPVFALAETERFAPLPAQDKTLAVLPFAAQGDDARLGADLAHELTDTLARTRGLRVLASRSGEALPASDGAESAGRALGADLVVEGTLRRNGNELRITARLVEVASGVQVWTERFDARFEDALALTERTAQRVTEALRLELSLRRGNEPGSARALELYLEGRRAHRRLDPDAAAITAAAVDALPDFPPALALHALVLVRRIFSFAPGERAAAERAVARALEQAPELAETQLAAGILAAYDAHYSASARLLRNAVRSAPTFADAQEYLGQLELEAGLFDEGRERIELALALDPRSPLAAAVRWRHVVFEGKTDPGPAWADLVRRTGSSGPSLRLWQTREALWSRRLAEVPRFVEPRDASTASKLVTIASYVVGGRPKPDIDAAVEQLLAETRVPRFAALLHQMTAEAWLALERSDAALAHICAAAEHALIDVEWLERCPSLRSLATDPGFAELSRAVRDRARAIWLD